MVSAGVTTWGKASKRSKGKGKLEREIAGGVLEAMVPSLSLSHDEYSSTVLQIMRVGGLPAVALGGVMSLCVTN